MKRFGIVFFALCSGAAFADDLLPPPWRLSNASATVQEWDFMAPNSGLAPDGNVWGSNGSGYVNPHGLPLLTNAQGFYQSTFGPRNGVWRLTLPTDELRFDIPNDTGGMGVKSVFIQVTWLDAQFTGPDVFLSSSSFSGQLTAATTNLLSDGWTHATYQVDFGPCPSSETIVLKGHTAGAVMFIDQVVIDTICRPVPEPATLASLAVGSFALLRRRKERQS